MKCIIYVFIVLFFRTFIVIPLITSCSVECVSLRCYRNSIEDYKEVDLDKYSALVESSYIDVTKDLNIVIHGYSTGITIYIEGVVESLMKVFGDSKNYCALNWEKESHAYIQGLEKPIQNIIEVPLIGVDYFFVSAIACGVGHHLGNILVKLVELGLKMESVYIIAHSEGAHLAGQAGRVGSAAGHVIGRITGLDPAKPAIEKHLDKSCAKLVDIVHSNPQMYGISSPAGHVDFYLNKECSAQPGCNEKPSLLSIFSLCSHRRSLLVMAEAIENPENFQGKKAKNSKEFMKSGNNTDTTDINYIGLKIDPSKTGSYYMCTNGEPPYGKGVEGTNPANCKC